MSAPKASLHIGKHKTGTTSFQKYISDHAAQLQEQGVLFVPMDLSNFIAASIIRDQLPIPPLKALSKNGVFPSTEEAYVKLVEFVAGQDFRMLLLSCEHFSYFRRNEEIDALRQLLLDAAGIEPQEISVYLVVREPESFLKSYTKQIIKTGHGVRKDKGSPYYCESDS